MSSRWKSGVQQRGQHREPIAVSGSPREARDGCVHRGDCLVSWVWHHPCMDACLVQQPSFPGAGARDGVVPEGAQCVALVVGEAAQGQEWQRSGGHRAAGV